MPAAMSVIGADAADPVPVAVVRSVTTIAAMAVRAATARAAINMRAMNMSARNGHRANVARCIIRWRMKSGFPVCAAKVIVVPRALKASVAPLRMGIAVRLRMASIARLG